MREAPVTSLGEIISVPDGGVLCGADIDFWLVTYITSIDLLTGSGFPPEPTPIVDYIHERTSPTSSQPIILIMRLLRITRWGLRERGSGEGNKAHRVSVVVVGGGVPTTRPIVSGTLRGSRTSISRVVDGGNEPCLREIKPIDSASTVASICQ